MLFLSLIIDYNRKPLMQTVYFLYFEQVPAGWRWRLYLAPALLFKSKRKSPERGNIMRKFTYIFQLYEYKSSKYKFNPFSSFKMNPNSSCRENIQF